MRETVLKRVRDKIAEVYHLTYRHTPAEELTAADAREIVVILGSSRSGSSFLFSLLTGSGAFWAPQGEETPFYRLFGLGWADSLRDSDVSPAPWSQNTLSLAANALMRDLGRAKAELTLSDREAYVAQAATRLLLQWPALEINPDDLLHSFRYWFEKSVTPEILWSNWLESSGLGVELYDLEGFPPRHPPSFAVPEFLIEEPPFVIQKLRHRPTQADLQGGVILLKTSANAYRIPLLRALFPQAKFKWVVLGRNPAASINGLMDGWLSGAFHSHDVRTLRGLGIKGYSNAVPGGESWWKFDLPPGWSDMATADLETVCAFQWTSAYRHIFAALERSEDPVLHIKYEDLIRPASREIALNNIFSFSGVQAAPIPVEALVRPVMASHPPSPARWRQREEQILPALKDASIQEIAAKLNYELGAVGDLI